MRLVRLRHGVRTKAPDGRSCAPRQALVCSGPFPLRRGMVLRALQSAAAGGGQSANTCDRCLTDVGSGRCMWIHRGAAPAGPAWPCEGVCAPPMRRCKACAGPRADRARCTRPPGSTTRTRWRPSALRRIPCRIPRRGGRSVGGGRQATSGREGGARGSPTVGEGGPGPLIGGRGRGASSSCRASSARPPATCRLGGSRGCGKRRCGHRTPGRGCPRGGVAIYVWCPARWGIRAPHWHLSATVRWRRATRVPSTIASEPTFSPSQLSSSLRSAAARSLRA